MTCALIYHDVVASGERDRCGFPGAVAAGYKLTPADFDAHLNAIADTGLSVGLIHGNPSVALTFDDGGASALDVAVALERRGWFGHFFVTTGRIGTPGFLDPDGVRELSARGHEVGSHSHTHPRYMGTMSRAELAHEWRLSRDVLGELTGSAPRSAAVPGGSLSGPLIEEASGAGYELLMTSTPTFRRQQVGAMMVHGRYTVWASTPARRVVAYASGQPWARATAWVGWQAKSAGKRVSPEAYEALRRRMRGARPGRAGAAGAESDPGSSE